LLAEGKELLDPMITQMKATLDARYRAELVAPFANAGLCLYPDDRGSVAWYGDTIGHGSKEDRIEAILSLGSPEPSRRVRA
jgi:hypothetical protein